MVAFGKNKLVSIKLSKEEQLCILQHCHDLDARFKNKINAATDGIISLMEGEADILKAILCYALQDIKNEEIVALFDGLIDRIPFSNEVTKHLDKFTVENCANTQEFEKLWDEIEAEKKTDPDPIRGNLTPEQITRFQNYIWGDSEFPLQFNNNLSLEEVNQSIFFRNTRLFLRKLMELKNESISTATGKLNRKFVKLMFDEMELDEKYRDSILRYNKVLNETDVFPLHIIRIICESAGLIKISSNKIIIPNKSHIFLSDEKAGELYYLLFEAYYQKFNLSYIDRLPEMEGIQATIDFSIYRLSVICNDYQSVEDLYYEIFLPAVMLEIEENLTQYISKERFVSSRIIKPLVGFGLVECRYKKEKYGNRVDQARKTPLFDKFISLNL